MWFHDSVPSKLQSLNDNGYFIVLFTNQSGAKDENKKSVLQSKLEAIARKIPAPVAIFMSAGSGYIRKPSTGVWEEAMKVLGIPLSSINKESSFYVGDAAVSLRIQSLCPKEIFSCLQEGRKNVAFPSQLFVHFCTLYCVSFF